ncbi:MAG: hypothetical protein UU47_C0001G0001 [candidate division TM6 bacterium GW2011_GWE2_41_16]|nr:MAG: hypothetical protein UU47_C0001G0001 [candidate division TM6 bacterium GW2011_GWE2_41_16]
MEQSILWSLALLLGCISITSYGVQSCTLVVPKEFRTNANAANFVYGQAIPQGCFDKEKVDEVLRALWKKTGVLHMGIKDWQLQALHARLDKLYHVAVIGDTEKKEYAALKNELQNAKQELDRLIKGRKEELWYKMYGVDFVLAKLANIEEKIKKNIKNVSENASQMRAVRNMLKNFDQQMYNDPQKQDT